MELRSRNSKPALTPVHEETNTYRYAKTSVLGALPVTPSSKASFVARRAVVPAGKAGDVSASREAGVHTVSSPKGASSKGSSKRKKRSENKSHSQKVEAAETAAAPETAEVQGVVCDPLEEFISLDETAPSGTPGGGIPARPPPPQSEHLSEVPWIKSLEHIASPSLRLHQETVELGRYLTPLPEEVVQREAAVARVAEVVGSIWPLAEVKVFGSFATGLYLPTSDMDAVILKSGCVSVVNGLNALANALQHRSMAKDIQVIARAKVPIIKFEEKESGYMFDISFDVANGPEAAKTMRDLMDTLPPMRPLVMVLKVFLHQRGLNEVYSGGMGSYALLVAVAAFLQLHHSRWPQQRGGSPRDLEPNLGILLIDFFRLYSRTLNVYDVGVSCSNGGAYFRKTDANFKLWERPHLLAVMDPCNASNDLGRNSYNIHSVRTAFEFAYIQLTSPSKAGESLLARVLRLEPVLFLRTPLPHLDEPKKRERSGVDESEHGRNEQDGNSSDQGQSKKKKKRKHRERSLSEEEGEWEAGKGRSCSPAPHHQEK